MMQVLTLFGLAFLVGSFFLIGMGSESKVEERKANFSFLGFILLMGSVVLLGAVVMTNMLS